MTDTLRSFARTIGIDYSGAETAEASLKGLRVYQTLGEEEAQEVLPPAGPKQYWTRRGLAAWLVQELDSRAPTIVGIDHAFSFPMRYFERHRLSPLTHSRLAIWQLQIVAPKADPGPTHNLANARFPPGAQDPETRPAVQCGGECPLICYICGHEGERKDRFIGPPADGAQ